MLLKNIKKNSMVIEDKTLTSVDKKEINIKFVKKYGSLYKHEFSKNVSFFSFGFSPRQPPILSKSFKQKLHFSEVL